MKSTLATSLALLTCGLVFVGHLGAEEPASSPERSLDRYTHIWTAKPFVAATVVSPQAESLAQRYAITGYGQFGGTDVVFILDRVSLNRFTISQEREENGVALLDVAEKEDASKLKARIRIGGEVAELSYDPGVAGIMAAGVENPVLASNGQPPIPNPNQGMPPQVSLPNQSQVTPVRRTGAPQPRRVIQRKSIQSQ